MFYRKKEEILYDSVIGLMVMIPPFQGGDPGSIPGLRTLFSPFLWKENGGYEVSNKWIEFDENVFC